MAPTFFLCETTSANQTRLAQDRSITSRIKIFFPYSRSLMAAMASSWDNSNGAGGRDVFPEELGATVETGDETLLYFQTNQMCPKGRHMRVNPLNPGGADIHRNRCGVDLQSIFMSYLLLFSFHNPFSGILSKDLATEDQKPISCSVSPTITTRTSASYGEDRVHILHGLCRMPT